MLIHAPMVSPVFPIVVCFPYRGKEGNIRNWCVFRIGGEEGIVGIMGGRLKRGRDIFRRSIEWSTLKGVL
jgi:hypothetical protein